MIVVCPRGKPRAQTAHLWIILLSNTKIRFREGKPSLALGSQQETQRDLDEDNLILLQVGDTTWVDQCIFIIGLTIRCSIILPTYTELCDFLPIFALYCVNSKSLEFQISLKKRSHGAFFGFYPSSKMAISPSLVEQLDMINSSAVSRIIYSF